MLQNKYYKIMKEFLGGYNKEIYGSSLSKKTNLSQKNVALTLLELEKKGVLALRLSGNRKYYFINFLNPLINDYLVFFELSRKIEFLEKHKKMIDFAREIRGEIVCIFGSYAKGTQTKSSDLDIFIVGKVDLMKIKKQGSKYGYSPQIFNMTLNDFKKNLLKKTTLIQEIMNEHVLLKGFDKFVEVVNG